MVESKATVLPMEEKGLGFEVFGFFFKLFKDNYSFRPTENKEADEERWDNISKALINLEDNFSSENQAVIEKINKRLNNRGEILICEDGVIRRITSLNYPDLSGVLFKLALEMPIYLDKKYKGNAKVYDFTMYKKALTRAFNLMKSCQNLYRLKAEYFEEYKKKSEEIISSVKQQFDGKDDEFINLLTSFFVTFYKAQENYKLYLYLNPEA